MTVAFADVLKHTVGVGGPPDPAADPFAAYKYLDTRRQTIVDSYHQRPLMRMWDENHNFIGRLTGEKSVTAQELMADSGAAGVVIRKNAWLSDFLLHDRRAEQDLHITLDPVPTQQDWPLRWGGKVTSIAAKRDSQGLHTVEMQAASNREHLKHVLAVANPVLPPEIQIPKMWILPMNCRSALSISLWVNLARQFFPLLSIPDNIFNPFDWLGTQILNLDPLNWPIQVQFVNLLLDQSRFEVFAAKFTDFHTASAPILEDAGCIWRGYTWLTTDPTSPHTELAALGNPFGNMFAGVPILGEALGTLGAITADLSRPLRNCVVMAVEDKSGTTGPTGTAADGMIKFLASTADDLITDVLIPQYDPDGDGQTDPLIAKWFGVAPAPAWVTFGDGDYSGIIESSRTQHAATAKRAWVGSRSPGWLNDLITFGIKYALAQLSAVISAPFFSYQQYGTPGLDELYQGELSDTLFAYQTFSNPVLEMYGGAFGYRESFNQASSTAWTVSGILGLRDEQWKNRAYTSYKTTVRNASPWCVGLDFALGDRVAFMMANIRYTDQVSGIKFSYDENSPLTWEISVGTDNSEIDPVSKALRGLAGIWNLFGMAMGSTELF